MSTKILIEGTTEAAWWRLVIERDGATISETCFDFAHAHRRAAEIMGIAEPASRATDDTVNGLMTAGATPAQVIDALCVEIEILRQQRKGWIDERDRMHCRALEAEKLLEAGVAR